MCKATKREWRRGIEVEYEHRPTYKFIKRYLKSNRRLPTMKMIAYSIARDHIKEIPNGYYLHKKYGLIRNEKYLKNKHFKCRKKYGR